VVLPAAPNAIYLSQVNQEFGSAFNTPINLNDADVRRFAKGAATYYVHTPVFSSAIYMSELRGKDLGSTSTLIYGPGTHTFTTPLHATLTVDVYGGGGGGGGGASRTIYSNQAGNQATTTRNGSPGGAGGGSSFGGILIGNGGGGGGGGQNLTSSSTTHDGAAGTAGGGNATNGGALNGGGDGRGAFAFWEGGKGGAGGRSWFTWTRGTFYAPGTLITITVGGGGAGGAPGPEKTYVNAESPISFTPGSPGGAGGNGAVYISWT